MGGFAFYIFNNFLNSHHKIHTLQDPGKDRQIRVRKLTPLYNLTTWNSLAQLVVAFSPRFYCPFSKLGSCFIYHDHHHHYKHSPSPNSLSTFVFCFFFHIVFFGEDLSLSSDNLQKILFNIALYECSMIYLPNALLYNKGLLVSLLIKM